MFRNGDMQTYPNSILQLLPRSEGHQSKAICRSSLVAVLILFTVCTNGCKRSANPKQKQVQNIHEAAAAGDSDAVERFLAEGVDVNVRGEMGLTPLHVAARNGHAGVVELLLERGADLEATDKGHMTALYWAATCGSLETVKMLVAKGANVNAKNKHGATPLAAVAMGRGECLEVALFLLDKGADISVRHSDGSTILHKAVLNGEPDVLRLLIENGADPAVKDKDGKTALDRARAISQAKFRRGTMRAKKKPEFEMCVQILEQQGSN